MPRHSAGRWVHRCRLPDAGTFAFQQTSLLPSACTVARYSDMAGAAGASERGASMVNETYAGMGVVEDGRGASMGYTCVFGNGNDSEDDDTDI